jgi:peroxiredoxin
MGLRILGISVDAALDGGTVNEFVRERGLSYDILLDPSRSSLQRFGVAGLPSTFVVDREGVVRLVRVGLVKEGDDAFEGVVQAALGCFDSPDRTCEP